jgi:hypothetical protein
MLDRNAARSAPGQSRLGLFGMVSAAALERVADAADATPACSPAAAMGVYAQLAVLASQQGTASSQGQRCTVTVAELAARCRMGRRTVHTYLALLADCGVLAVDHRFDTRGNPLASTLVFVYPRRDAPPAPPVAHPPPPPAADPPSDRTDSATAEPPGAGDGPREGPAAGGTRVSEREEEKDDSLAPERGVDKARAYLKARLGWVGDGRGYRPPPWVTAEPAAQRLGGATRLRHADGVS